MRRPVVFVKLDSGKYDETPVKSLLWEDDKVLVRFETGCWNVVDNDAIKWRLDDAA